MNDIATELIKLHELTGAEFSRQVEGIAKMHVFHLVEGETNIFADISESDRDYNNQIRAARKLLLYGYRVFLLPNPKNGRTPDMIVERKGTKRYSPNNSEEGLCAESKLRESVHDAL